MQDKDHLNAYKFYHTRSTRLGVGFETGMFQTAVIRKTADFRRAHSVPQMPDSPTFFPFIPSTQSPEKRSPEQSAIPMLINPRTPTGRKKSSASYDYWEKIFKTSKNDCMKLPHKRCISSTASQTSFNLFSLFLIFTDEKKNFLRTFLIVILCETSLSCCKMCRKIL